MATVIGTRAAKHGHTVEFMSRNPARAQALADQIGNGATVGTYGARPAGDIVVVAVLYTGAVDVVAHYGEALSGKVLVDITNPFNADVTGLVTAAGDSVSQRIAAVAPENTPVVKACAASDHSASDDSSRPEQQALSRPSGAVDSEHRGHRPALRR